MHLPRLLLNQELLNIALEISCFFQYLDYSISTAQQEIFMSKPINVLTLTKWFSVPVTRKNSIIVSFFIIKNCVVWHLQHVHKPAMECKEAFLWGHLDSHGYVLKHGRNKFFLVLGKINLWYHMHSVKLRGGTV